MTEISETFPTMLSAVQWITSMSAQVNPSGHALAVRIVKLPDASVLVIGQFISIEAVHGIARQTHAGSQRIH